MEGQVSFSPFSVLIQHRAVSFGPSHCRPAAGTQCIFWCCHGVVVLEVGSVLLGLDSFWDDWECLMQISVDCNIVITENNPVSNVLRSVGDTATLLLVH